MPKRKPPKKGAQTMRVLATPEPPSDSRLGSLVVVQGAEADLGRHIIVDEPVTIGRDEAVELSLRDGSISRRHCRVEREGDRYVLVDLGSTNGTAVNKHRVEARYPLAPGDKIFLGASVVGFGLADDLDRDYHSKVNELVRTDPLSGMWVRRQYDATFAEYADRAEEKDLPLSVLVMDVDGLKAINDAHGHGAGSFVIGEVSKQIRAIAASRGILCRYGGDEFVAAFLGMPLGEATVLAERLRAEIGTMGLRYAKHPLHFSLSIGVASFPDHADDPHDLFTLADKVLLKSKRLAKDRVVIAERDE